MLSFIDLDECTTGSDSCDVNSVILYARIPWVHTRARVMLGTQEMENLAMGI